MKRFVAVLLIVVFALPFSSCSPESASRSDVVLGSAIALGVNAVGAGANAATDEMFSLADKVFSEMNLGAGSGMLSRFNASDSTEPFEINGYIYDVLLLARTAYEKSGGAFDVTALPLSELWGVNIAGLHASAPDEEQLKETALKSVPSYESVKETLAHVGMDKLSFYSAGERYFLQKSDPLVKVDLGGIAKGYFADLCADIARKYELKSCLINISGNIYLHGTNPKNGGNWKVGVMNPRPRLVFAGELFRGDVVAVNSFGNRSFVTSGDYQRFYYYNPIGETITCEAQLVAVCHVISPITGLPVGIKYDGVWGYTTDYGAVCSATVSGEKSALCDAYSTAVMVLGAADGKKLLASEGFDGLIFTNPDMPYGDGYKTDGATAEFTRTKIGKGRMIKVGEWDFLPEYDAYKTEYEYDE